MTFFNSAAWIRSHFDALEGDSLNALYILERRLDPAAAAIAAEKIREAFAACRAAVRLSPEELAAQQAGGAGASVPPRPLNIRG